MTGTISKVISDNGFGFLQGEDGQEYFIHRSAVRDGSVFEQLREGQPVVFDAGRGDEGLRAENAGLLSRANRRTRNAPLTRRVGAHQCICSHSRIWYNSRMFVITGVQGGSVGWIRYHPRYDPRSNTSACSPLLR